MQDVSLGMTVRNSLEPLHPIYPTFKVDVKSETPISIEIVDVFDLMMRLLEMKESLLVQMYGKDYHIIERKMLRDYSTQPVQANAIVAADDTNEEDAQIKDYDEVVRAYYAMRSGNPKSKSWSEQMTGLLEKESRPHMRTYLTQQGFEMK